MGSLEGTLDTKLHEAVRYGDLEDVRIALQQGYDPNLIGLYQWSSLHEAASNGDVQILKLLLKHKGNPNKQDLLVGNTSVHYAAKEDNVECLELLLEAGGLYTITNNEGKNCLEVATGECFQILESLKVKDMMTIPGDGTEGKIQDEDNRMESPELDTSISTEEGSHADDVKAPALGYIHLTFEYHSHKGTLKIRVWQISDLLLPPPSTSMISTIYVKSYLMPDKKRESKRKTEEVKVEKVAAHVQFTKSELSKGVQHVFSPSTFQFSKKLEYDKVNKEMVKSKSVQIEVCITQKYSKRSFLIAMFHLPLASAVKKIVRDRYPLIPCMNHTIPASMKVYCASQLQITNSNKIFYSNPDVRNLSVSDVSEATDRAASDPDLQGVTVVTPRLDVVTPRSISLDVSEEVINPSPRDHKLDEVIIKAVSKHSSDVNIPREFLEGEISSDEETSKISSKVIEIPNESDDELQSDKTKSAFTSIKNIVKGQTHVEELSKVKIVHSLGDLDPQESPRGVENWKYSVVKKSSHSSKRSGVTESGSRPETPTWDYYDFDDMQVVVSDIPIDEPSASNKGGAAPVILPMETTLGLRSERSSTKSKKREKTKKSEEKWPGKAVPAIVITDTDEEKKNSKSQSLLSSRSQGSPKKSLTTKKKAKKKEEEIVLYTPESKKQVTEFRPASTSIDIREEGMSRTDDGKFKVTADVHSTPVSAPSPDTSISINVEDSDSFIIDLENLEDDLADKSEEEDSITLTQSEMSLSSKFKSKLTQPVPMQVFIDDSIYDSDDLSEMNYIFSLDQGHNSDQVTEV